jgi:Coenzyme PQQ synthesis protein D (PqqD)
VNEPGDHPRKAADLEINEMADGHVVYQESRDRVHYLNHTAAVVLEFCTGENEVDEIVRLLQAAYELPEPPQAEIVECLEQLRTEGLVA